MVLSEASNDSGSTYKQCLFNCQLWNLQKTRCLYPFVLIRTKRALPSFKIPPVFTKLTRPSFTVFGQGFHGLKNKYGTGRGPRFPGGKIRRGPLDGGRRPTRPHPNVFGPRKTPIGGRPSVPSVPKPESGGLDLQHKSPLPNVQRDTFGFPSSRVLPRNIKTIRLQRRRSPGPSVLAKPQIGQSVAYDPTTYRQLQAIRLLKAKSKAFGLSSTESKILKGRISRFRSSERTARMDARQRLDNQNKVIDTKIPLSQQITEMQNARDLKTKYERELSSFALQQKKTKDQFIINR